MFSACIRRLASLDPARFFLVASLFFSVLYAILTPPFQVADEYAHFERAYAVANGEFLPLRNPGPRTEGWFIPLAASRAGVHGGGTLLPGGVLRSYGVVDYLSFRPETRIAPPAILQELRQPLHTGQSAFLVNNAVVYTPAPYLPQALVILALKPFDLSPFWMVYAGRLLCALAWSLLVYAAIRLLPAGKWIMAFVALSPMAVSLGGSLSADPLTTGCFFLLTAFLLRHLADERLTTRTLSLMIGLCLAVALCKSLYVLLLPLLFFWTPGQFASRLRYGAFLLCALGLPLLLTVWWGGQVQDLFLSADNASVQQQKEFIRQEPLEFGKVMVRTAATYGRVYARHFAGSLGWLDAQLPFAVAALYLLGLGLIAAGNAGTADSADSRALAWQQRFSRGKRIFCLLLFGVLFLIMCVSMYAVWNDYRNPVIVGLHGRYFIPLAPLALLCLFRGISPRLRQHRMSGRILQGCRSVAPLLLLFCLLTGATVLLGRYYGIGPLQSGSAATPGNGAADSPTGRGHPVLLPDPWQQQSDH